MFRVARKKPFCNVLGPGTRCVVWFYGCSKRCPGCIAGTMNDTDEYELYTPRQLTKWVLANDGIEGITLSGGEPFEQPLDELQQLLECVKQKSHLSIISYTGYRLEDMDFAKNVLQYVDVLIDGEYRQEEDAGQRWRGSANQRFHFLTERYRSEAEMWNNTFERQIEIELDLQGKLLISGVPSKQFVDKLTAELHKRDIDADFS